MSFRDLGLCPQLTDAVEALGYDTPTPIQNLAIPLVLDGKDVLGCAQTGTGKTAAFSLPMLQRLSEHRTGGKRYRPVRALILAPTRELAAQIDESIREYGAKLRMRQKVVFGGVSKHHQIQALRRGVDILTATPGRLLDLLGDGFFDLGQVEMLILDEADRMLDMGFIHDIRRVVKQVPNDRQTLMFSATMEGNIRELAESLLHEPEFISVQPPGRTADRIQQAVYHVNKDKKIDLLFHILDEHEMERVLVFSRTKHGADRIVKKLARENLRAVAIHGNKSQNQRERALKAFKSGQAPVMVATDIASRGLDIDEVSHVINYDLPNEPESYVHRIGRTARAGAEGIAFSFCAADEAGYLRDIERLTKLSIEVDSGHPFHMEPPSRPGPGKGNGRGGRNRNRNRNRNRSRQGNRQHASQGE